MRGRGMVGAVDFQKGLEREKEWPGSPVSPLSPTPSSGASSPIKFVHVDPATFISLSGDVRTDASNGSMRDPKSVGTDFRLRYGRSMSGPLAAPSPSSSGQEAMAEVRRQSKSGPLIHNVHRNGALQYHSGPIPRCLRSTEFRKEAEESEELLDDFCRNPYGSRRTLIAAPSSPSPSPSPSASSFPCPPSPSLPSSNARASPDDSSPTITPFRSAASRKVTDWNCYGASPEAESTAGCHVDGPHGTVLTNQRPPPGKRRTPESQAEKEVTAYRLPPLPLSSSVGAVQVPALTGREGGGEIAGIITRGLAATASSSSSSRKH